MLLLAAKLLDSRQLWVAINYSALANYKCDWIWENMYSPHIHLQFFSTFHFYKIYLLGISYRCQTFSDCTASYHMHSFITPESFKPMYQLQWILWILKCGKLDVWTMHIFANLVTNYINWNPQSILASLFHVIIMVL